MIQFLLVGRHRGRAIMSQVPGVGWGDDQLEPGEDDGEAPLKRFRFSKK